MLLVLNSGYVCMFVLFVWDEQIMLTDCEHRIDWRFIIFPYTKDLTIPLKFGFFFKKGNLTFKFIKIKMNDVNFLLLLLLLIVLLLLLCNSNSKVSERK